MSRDRVKSQLSRAPRVSPFLVIGDPTPEISLELAKAAVLAGAEMIELGFPYGDPVADGPAIQAADVRALAAGTSTTEAIALLRRMHDAVPRTSLNLLVYGNLVHARGFDRFCGEVTGAGASTLLVPDIPLEESAVLRRACRKSGLGHVQLAGPLTSKERLVRIDRMADSFVYLVAHQGVTGVRSEGFEAVEKLVARVARVLSNPLCLGFGLSKREQIEKAFRAGARLAVVGSHLVSVIGAAWADDVPGRDARVVRAFSEAMQRLATSETGRKEKHAGHHA